MAEAELVTPESAGSGGSNMRSVERAMDVLDALARHEGPMRLADVARAAGLHRATALRILTTLQKRDYVTSDAGGYRIGVAMLGAAHAFLVSDSASRAATPVLQELAATTGLTASYHVRSGMERVLVARVEGSYPLRYQLPIGQRLPLYLGAGKILAAWMTAAELDELIGSAGTMRTVEGVVVTPEALREQLDLIRTRGYHLSVHERAAGTAGVSAPVHGPGGNVVGVATLSGPSERYSIDELEAWVPELRRAAGALATAQARAV
jgi:IclR family transcriptional regulator, acetate operon repressor